MRRLLTISLLALSLAACNKAGAPSHAGDKAAAEDSAQRVLEGKAFLEKNAKEPGVKTTASGLQYKVIRSGPEGGPHPKPTDEVKVNYEGRFIDGAIFDSSYEGGTPVTFVLNQVVPGWTEALQLMRPGDEWEIYLPPQLGYGEQERPGMPANSTLIFKVELLDVFQH